MAELEAMQTVVTQAAIQAIMAAVIVMREADAAPTLCTNTISSGEAHKQRYGGPALKQPFFKRIAPDKYAELLGFEVEVTDILQRYMN